MAGRKNSSENVYGTESLHPVLFESILKNSSDAIAITTPSGEIVSWNPAAENLFGYPANEILGKSISRIAAKQNQFESKLPCKEKTTCLTKDGKEIPVIMHCDIVPGPDNNTGAQWFLFRDLREQVMHEERLHEKDRAMESFTYSVSHDLRAPLRRIINYAQILEEDHASSLNDEVTRLISRMVKNAQKMSELMDDILAYSRISQQPMRKSKVSVSNLVENIILDLKKQSETSRISFSVLPMEDAVADPALLKRVFENLLQNAVKFTRHTEQPVVEIGCEIQPDAIHYYVKDNGVGFDPQYSSKLFTIFHRLHTPAEYEGNGIGLAIVQQIIARHGGKVWAEGKPSDGSVFWIALPK